MDALGYVRPEGVAIKTKRCIARLTALVEELKTNGQHH
ncbi:MAG: hypothetical protein JWP84_1224 [Tardiphaga sp.]|nr:hypothetical protein [Tardiphaga sp.]